MEQIASFETPFTEKINSDFQLFHLVRRKIATFTLLIVMIAFSAGLLLFLMATQGPKFNQSSGVVSVVIMAMIIAMYFSSFLKGKRLYLAQVKQYGDIINTCTFFEDYFTQENVTGKLQLEYSKVSKIYETSKYFYIYFSKTSACIIKKDLIKSGTVASLKAFFQTRLTAKQLCILK